MSYEKNQKVKVKDGQGGIDGIIKDRFIQTTELDYDGSTLIADASEENPVYLVELEGGEKKMVAEHGLQ